jgi:hypothetical protein
VIGLVTAEARAEVEKARKKRADRERGERERGARQTVSDAHAAAEGAVEGALDAEGDGARKAITDRGAHLGPSQPVQPGQIDSQDLRRPYITEGHGAPSPGYQPPNVPHLDLSRSRGVLTHLNPHAPLPVQESRP